MNGYPNAFTAAHVNGGFNGWCGSCNPLTDSDMDGIWEGTIAVPNGLQEFKFTVDGWTDQEIFVGGEPCTNTTGPYTNRQIDVTADDTLAVVCFNQCAACDKAMVKFAVDMNQAGLTFTEANVNGTFNNWCGACNPLTDTDMDGVWEGTFVIDTGATEYKFTVDGWSNQENLTSGSFCTITTGPYTNRFINAADMTLSPVCWGSCDTCAGVISKVDPDLPITFEDTATVDYALVDFGGNMSMIAVDPTDPNNLVVQSTKTMGAQTWGGTVVADNGLVNPIPFTANDTKISVRVWSPTAGTPVLLKVEDATNNQVSVETLTNTTMTGAWETLEFDFTNHQPNTPALDLNASYGKIAIFFNFGTSPAADETYYWDDIEMVLPSQPDLPITFEDTLTIDYALVDFGGNNSMIIADPTNANNLVVESIKTMGAQTWGGTVVADNGLLNPIPFTATDTRMTVDVWSPTAGTPVLLKVEDATNNQISVENAYQYNSRRRMGNIRV